MPLADHQMLAPGLLGSLAHLRHRLVVAGKARGHGRAAHRLREALQRANT